MLGFFSKQPDHPLADPREAKKVCAEISARDPIGAIEEADAWLQSLAVADGFKLATRIERVMEVEEAATPQVRRLGREYLKQGSRNANLEAKLWAICHDYWKQVATTYEMTLGRFVSGEKDSAASLPLRGQLIARLLHAHVVLLKWKQYRYGPIEDELWRVIGTLYLDADTGKLARNSVTLYVGHAPTSIEAEYLKALLLQASAMDSLLPVEIELAERLIANFLPLFTLTREVRPENVYWVDAAKATPPRRLAQLPEVTPSLRFFNGVAALKAVADLQQSIQSSRGVPANINLGGQYEAKVVMDVLAHLAACWAPKPPMRKDARRRIKSRLDVAHGLPDVYGRVAGTLAGPAGIEVWMVDDVSLGGMGAQVQLRHKDWISLGVLVAIQPEGGKNWLVGRVRRFARVTTSQGQVGIETLSKSPVAIKADADGLATDVILLDPLVAGDDVRVLVAPGVLEGQLSLSLTAIHEGKSARLYGRETMITGADFAVARFFVASYA